MLQKAFNMFDTAKKGSIDREKVRTILNTLGQAFKELELEALLDAEDSDGKSLFFYIDNNFKISFTREFVY